MLGQCSWAASRIHMYVESGLKRTTLFGCTGRARVAFDFVIKRWRNRNLVLHVFGEYAEEVRQKSGTPLTFKCGGV